MHLYYVYVVFDFARTCSVEQEPTLSFKIQKVEDEVWREREEARRRRMFSSTHSVLKQLVHLAQLVKALDFKV